MKQKTSINRMIIFRILILLCVSVLSLTMFYVSTVNTVRENTSQILSNLTELYQNEIDGNLANVGDSLDEIIYRSHFLEEFQKTGSDELYFASMELAEILETKVVSNTGADVYFVLNPSENLKLIRTGSRVNAVQIGEIYDYFE